MRLQLFRLLGSHSGPNRTRRFRRFSSDTKCVHTLWIDTRTVYHHRPRIGCDVQQGKQSKPITSSTGKNKTVDCGFSRQQLFEQLFFNCSVCLQRIWHLSTSTMCRSTCFAMRAERRNGGRHGKDFLPKMPMRIPSATRAIQASWWSRSGWSRRSCFWNHVSTFVSHDVQQFSARPTSKGFGLHPESIWLSSTHVGTAAC